MSLYRPTLQQLIDRIAADLMAVFGATSLALRAFLQILGRALAGMTHSLYGYLDGITLELFALTALGEYLERIGSEWGILRNAATRSTGTLTITGTVGAVIPARTILQSPAGNQYTTDAEATVGVGGTITVGITAYEAGAASDETGTVTLSFVTPIAGVDSTALTDANGLSGGADEETDNDYRVRILARKRFAPQGGCAEDYITWAKEVAGVTRAWVYPGYQGRGTLAVLFMRDKDTNPFPSTAELAVVRAHIVSHVDSRGVTVGCPVTAEPGLTVMAPAPKIVNFSIALYPNTPDVQAQVQAELEDLLYRKGTPGGTIYLSEISEAVSFAADEEHNRIIAPISDIICAYNEVAVLGSLTWSAY